MRFNLFLISCLASLLTCATVLAEDFLPPQKAFDLVATADSAGTVKLNWKIAPGYYLYRERLKLHGKAGAAPELLTPAGDSNFDANFNRTMEVYHHQLELSLEPGQFKQNKALVIEYQGCAEKGLCYPPQYARVEPVPPAAGGSTPAVTVEIVEQPDAQPAIRPVAVTTATPPQTDLIGATLAQGSLIKTAGVFWVAGLLLALTPCMLPMVPILSTLIAGQAGPVSRRKGFMLALSYVLGMAIVYSGMGMAAGLAGEGLAAALQNPWVLGSFAAMLAGLALGMFGVYELQMPTFIQNRAIGWSNRFQGGSYAAVFIMGGLSALILGPCVAAPLAGALVYISQTRNAVTGGTALFFMALGMGAPLLLVGMSAGSLLPRTGAWMELVKHIFGVVLLATAVWIVSPALPVQVQMLLWSAWLLATAYVLGGLLPRNQPHILRLAGLASAALAVVLLVGAASGGKSVLQPLAHLQVSARTGQGNAAPAAGTAQGLPFRRVSTLQELEAALTQASARQQTTMLDFYADWCVACKEFESFTFSDPAVRDRIARGQIQLLQADVTSNNAHDKALLKRFALFGPPAIVFLKGAEPASVAHQVVGYQNASEFLASLDRALVH
ncbi:protein-disulfide reductase DsbD [soil metagenome]